MAGTVGTVGSVDLDAFRLRTFVGCLGSGELDVIERRIDLAELAAELEGNDRAVHFRNVGPEGAEVVGNVVASRTRIARAFGVEPRALLPELLARLRHKPEIIELTRDEAPAQQIVATGADADFTTLPIHLQHGLDGGPYISAAVDYVRDARTGLTNVGVRRLMLRGRQEAGIDLISPSDLRAIYEAAVARGDRLPISFVVGCHPLDHVAATMRLPVDELGIVASLRGGALPVVKCVTNEIRVPADAEYVLEGYLDARGYCEPEGPYGEFLGYYGELKRNPVFHLTAVTRRRDALFQTMTISGSNMGRTDNAPLVALRTEATVWRALESAVREPLAVYATSSSGGMFNVRISLRQRVPGEARNAIAAAFSSLGNVKNVFVVDPDIDVFSDTQMDWALATRFQAKRDLMVEGGFRALPLDPSLGPEKLGSKAGFDLTWPFGTGGMFERQVPTAPAGDGVRYGSIEAALDAGPKFFGELMDAVGSRDGRDIIRGLEDLRATKQIVRDAHGRYLIGDTRTRGSDA